MTHDDAVVVVVRAGREGQKELLNVLFEEMNSKDMEEILEKNGFVLKDG